VTAFAEGQGAAHRMFKIIERKPDIDIDDNTGIILEDVKGDVQLKDMYFNYPTRPEFSLQVPSGTTMALVGDSAVGNRP
jgi:ATP-binding cassette, subfamily B (MDR/TAP), member 1